uniref:Uncharacterized protein n=1 Tax=Rhizophora mucronata TaxID=61149 RepID=A0A2P2QPP1_RHIMU
MLKNMRHPKNYKKLWWYLASDQDYQ